MLHQRRFHMEYYVTFVQQRVRFLRLLCANNLIRTSIMRRRFLRQRKAAIVIQRAFLEWNYTPGNPGYRRLAQRWSSLL